MGRPKRPPTARTARQLEAQRPGRHRHRGLFQTELILARRQGCSEVDSHAAEPQQQRRDHGGRRNFRNLGRVLSRQQRPPRAERVESRAYGIDLGSVNCSPRHCTSGARIARPSTRLQRTADVGLGRDVLRAQCARLRWLFGHGMPGPVGTPRRGSGQNPPVQSGPEARLWLRVPAWAATLPLGGCSGHRGTESPHFLPPVPQPLPSRPLRPTTPHSEHRRVRPRREWTGRDTRRLPERR